MVTIRPYEPFDLPGIYRACLATGDSGKDAGPSTPIRTCSGTSGRAPIPWRTPG